MILSSFKDRGVTDILLGVIDGLPGLEDSFNKIYSKADIQRCIAHKVKNTMQKVCKKDLPKIVQNLKSHL